jgi:hypothetical protein
MGVPPRSGATTVSGFPHLSNATTLRELPPVVATSVQVSGVNLVLPRIPSRLTDTCYKRITRTPAKKLRQGCQSSCQRKPLLGLLTARHSQNSPGLNFLQLTNLTRHS